MMDAAYAFLFSPLQNGDAFVNIVATVCRAASTRFCPYSDAGDFHRVGRCATHLQFLPDIAAKWSDQMRDVVRILCDQSSWWKLAKRRRPRPVGWEISTAIPDVREHPGSMGASWALGQESTHPQFPLGRQPLMR
jgi:hypothetical protein